MNIGKIPQLTAGEFALVVDRWREAKARKRLTGKPFLSDAAALDDIERLIGTCLCLDIQRSMWEALSLEEIEDEEDITEE